MIIYSEMIHKVLAFLFGIAVTLVEKLGYWGILFGLMIGSACIPLPSEAVQGFAGYLVSQGKMNLWLAVAAGTTGTLIGSSLMYYLGKHGGKQLVLKYGKYVLVGEEEFGKAEKWYGKYGDKAIFIAQLLPVVRSYIALPAGILAKSYSRYILYTGTGAFAWSLLMVYIGKVLGDNWKELSQYLKPVEWVLVLAVLAVGTWYIYKRLSKLKRKKK